jgi:hypothetical protein
LNCSVELRLFSFKLSALFTVECNDLCVCVCVCVCAIIIIYDTDAYQVSNRRDI